MADQLATPEDLAALLERDDIETYKSIVLIEAATAVVQAITGQRIVEVVDDVVTFDLDEIDNGTYLSLPERPVTAVTAVMIGSTPVTDFTVQLRRGRLWRAHGWWSYPRAYIYQPSGVTVTYTHGFPVGDQRLQLARSAVLSLIKGAYGNSIGASQVQIDDFVASYSAMAAQMEASDFLQAALRRRYSRSPDTALLTTGVETASMWRT